jgi:aminodeoxyfutalosine synthase
VSWFNRNQHINATNVCEATCMFCSFSRLKTGDRPPTRCRWRRRSSRLRALADSCMTEVHIVNGLNPDLPFEYYTDLLRALKAERPDLHIKGFTAVEIHYYAQKYGMTYAEVLRPCARPASTASPAAAPRSSTPAPARSSATTRSTPTAGCRSTARPTPGLPHELHHALRLHRDLDERVDHLDRLRSLQDETGGFQTFIPLKFHNENNRLRNVAETTGLDCLRTLAVSRIYLDNFPHVKAYWPMMGMAVAQLSQAFGVSDLDGTVREERIYHMAGATTPQELTRNELIGLIERADRLALERDTLYRVAAETPALLEVSGPAAPARIASVGYLNARPLTDHLDRSRHTVVDAVPSEVAELLVGGSVDVALVPVAAILSGGDWCIVPGMAIGADGPVESVLLVAETPPEQWTEVLLDGDSRTSAVLTRLLLTRGPLAERAPGVQITTVGRGEAPGLAGGSRAALVIGDAARELPERFTVRFDLAELWKQWTGLPFVFAVWAGRPDLDPRLGAELREAARRGLAELPDRYAGADRTYLTERLRYALDDRALMGLRRFAALGREAGLFPTGDLALLPPEQTRRPRDPSVSAALIGPRTGSDAEFSRSPDGAGELLLLANAPLAELIQAAAQVQRARGRLTVAWALRGVGGDLPAEVARVRPEISANADLCALVAGWPGRVVELPLAAVLRAGLKPSEIPGLGALDLDDGGPLFPDAQREAAVRDALAAGIEVLGCAPFGRGESVAARLAHLRALAALGVRSVVVRVTPWRGPGTEGHGTAADWLRAAGWVRLVSELDVLVPQELEGLAVVQVALQSCADGVTPLAHGPDWEEAAWKLDRSIRDAGYEPLRLGMETPSARASRVARRPAPKPIRPDLR